MTLIAGIVKEGQLVPEEKWKQAIFSLENSFDGLETNKERAKRRIKDALVNAVKKRTEGNFGLLFSGGVDSSILALIAKQLGKNMTCYTVGIENSQDVEWAQKVAQVYGFHHEYKVLSLDELEYVVKQVVELTKRTDIVTVGVGSVLYAAGKMALATNIHSLFGGLGSEEIFAGYQRHGETLRQGLDATHKECWNGLRNMWNRDLVRDFRLASQMGIELRTPFLDKDVIIASMDVHPMFKIDGTEKKVILREIAEELGLQKEFAWRKKSAAQYGSNFVKGLDKLARRNGYSLKKEYLETLGNQQSA